MTGIHLRLVAGVAAVVLLGVLVTGSLAERRLRLRETERIETGLQQRAELVRGLLSDRPLGVAERASLQTLIAKAGRADDARITLVAADGTVIADSEVVASALPGIENHADRPEIRAALRGEVGRDQRRSRTLQRELLYVGVPGPEGSVVRTARSLEEVERQVAELRWELLLAGALTVLLTTILAAAFSARALRPVRELHSVVGSLADGDLDRRLPWRSSDEMGAIAGALDRVADQLRQQLREVTAEKEQLQAVLAGMVEGVLVVDPKDRVLVANPRFRELFGVWGEMVGRPHWEMLRRPEVEEGLRSAASSGEAVVLELSLDDAEGRVLQMHAVRFPERGELRGIVAVFHDVTELRRLEGIRREFVANVSHELKTPLTAIRGFAETLLHNGVAPEQREQYLHVILRHSERLGRLIEDILDLSRIESRKLALEAVELDVGRLAASLLRDLEPQFASRSLRAELEDPGDATAWADRQSVEQVISNLLDNAAKYTDPGGRIVLRLVPGRDRLRVEVEDDGIGIPEADLPRIFERFYRVDKARSRDLGGTGLGLSIVKHLVQVMGGDVHVESRPGRGSCFSFSLPRQPEETR